MFIKPYAATEQVKPTSVLVRSPRAPSRPSRLTRTLRSTRWSRRVYISSTARPGWAAPCPSWELSSTSSRSARPCSGFAAVSTAERSRAFVSKASARADVNTAVCYQSSVECGKLTWEDFRGKVLGGTNPKTTCPTSLRYVMFMGWKRLGLAAELNFGTTWSTLPPACLRLWPSSPIGSRNLTAIEAECDDPVVLYQMRLSSCLQWWRTWTARTV